MSTSVKKIVIFYKYLSWVCKLSFTAMAVLLIACGPAKAQTNEDAGLLNDQIDHFKQKMESGGALNGSEIQRLGYLHYQRGLAYKALYLFSLDASLRALENLELNYGLITDSRYYDLLRIRKHSFLNNRSAAETIIENYDGDEYFNQWETSNAVTKEITSINQIVANWYKNPERGMECGPISDRSLNEFCNTLYPTISDFDQYLKGERLIRDFLPVSRDELIDYRHTELIGFVDNFHAHWAYDFSVSFWLLDSIGSTQKIYPLFQSRKWNVAKRFEDSSNDAGSRILHEIAGLLPIIQTAENHDPFQNMINFDAHKDPRRWVIKVNSLLEGVDIEAIKKLLIESDYRQIFNQRIPGQATQIAEILIRAQKTNSARNIISRYLPQSGSYNIKSYSAHRLALSAHFNFTSGGVGGENVAKAQLIAFQQQFPTIMPLYLLVQLATEREAGNPNDLIQTN